MKKLVYSALALTLVSVPALASDNGWSGLDKSIDGLASSLAEAKAGGGPAIGGFVRTSYRHSDDIPAGTSTQSGTQFDNIRVEISGDANEDYGYKITFDLAGGSASLKDAWASFKIIDQVSARFGRFKQPVLRSGLVSDAKLILLDRTGLGEAVGGRRDIGVLLKGSMEILEWKAAMQNGSEGQGNDQTFTLRVGANVIGKGVADDGVEGAYGAGDETNLSIAASIFDDTALVDGMVIAAEVNMTMGPFSVAAEIADFDDNSGGIGIANGLLAFAGASGDAADTTPWDVTVSYRINEQYEVAGRYEDADDSDDTTAWTIGVNRYISGHKIKWTAQWRSIKTDNAVGDVDQAGLGLCVAF